ncbi:hypothetical protein AB205_0011470 [Aquarana catesbeiana]|uniref:Vacuolar protein sorting-associated protein 33A n=1 Tax=Aquarana catesbeiana TaxID=8400 RepID=A0A2G9SH45_AQUCT|nr:hypothetical protein AB205_0011470 [Aquarana catesbeiana]
MQTYGYQHILTLHNLEKAGLLKSQTSSRNNYPTIRKTLRLWMDDVNEQVSWGKWYSQQGENKVMLIFFLGGVTFAEIAALRFLSQLEDGGTEYIIATTKLINGTTWIKSLMEKHQAEPC